MFRIKRNISLCYCQKHHLTKNNMKIVFLSFIFWFIAIIIDKFKYIFSIGISYEIYIHCIAYVLFIVGIVTIFSLIKSFPCYYYYKSIHDKLFWLSIFVFTMSAASRFLNLLYSKPSVIILMKYYIYTTILITIITLIDVMFSYKKIKYM